MSNSLITLKDVSLSLQGNAGQVDILRNISLTIEKGESVGLIGPSGSGKSSLLMLLGGLERASGGQLSIAGRDIRGMNEDQLARFRRDTMGIVFQSFHLIPTMTALENVATPLELAGDKDAFAKAEAELDTVSLGHRKNHYPSQMSGGEQQRVAVARAMVVRPAILLADEPTGNLDPDTAAQVLAAMSALRDRDTAFVVVTHDPAIAQRMDRQLTLANGRLEAR